MSFSASDISKAIQRGISPCDPRFANEIVRIQRDRRALQCRSRASGILHSTREVAHYQTASEWLAANPCMHVPICLGHEPKTVVHERGTKRFVFFHPRGDHDGMVFEVRGRRFQRLM